MPRVFAGTAALAREKECAPEAVLCSQRMLRPSEAVSAGLGVALARSIAEIDARGPDTPGLSELKALALGALNLVDTDLRIQGLHDEPTARAGVADHGAWAERRSRAVEKALAGTGALVALHHLGLAAGAALAAARGAPLLGDPDARRLRMRAVAELDRLAGSTLLPPVARAKAAQVAAQAALHFPDAAAAIDAAMRDRDFFLALENLHVTTTSSADEAKLLERILAHPDEPGYAIATDNQLREAYAAAIAPRDKDRAELIRVQLALHQGRVAMSTPPGAPQREADLLRAYGRDWCPVRDLVKGHRFMRGFVEEVDLDAAGFLARARDVYARAPVTHLRVRGGAREHAAALFASPALARLRSLDLAGEKIGDEGVRLLAASPHVGHLVALRLDGNDLTYAGLEHLARGRNLGGLQHATFTGNQVESPSSETLGVDDAGYPTGWVLPASGLRLERSFGRLRWLHTERWPESDSVDVALAGRLDD